MGSTFQNYSLLIAERSTHATPMIRGTLFGHLRLDTCDLALLGVFFTPSIFCSFLLFLF